MVEIAAQQLSSMGMADLTMTVKAGMRAFPGSPPPAFINWADADRDGYSMELLFMSSHTGTHMDAPLHFAKNGASVDRIRPSVFMRPASAIRAPSGANATATKRDIVAFESKHGKLEPDRAVVFSTGWSSKPDRRGYFESNPGISADAAAHLVLRKVGIVAIDSPSIDAGSAHSFPAHRSLSGAGIPILENLVNLDRIPAENFTLLAVPLKLGGATGSPARAMALWGNDAPHRGQS